AFLALVPGDGDGGARKAGLAPLIAVSRPVPLLVVFAIAVVAGGMTFNVTTIAMPKVIDERLGDGLPLALIGSLASAVFVFGALMQLAMGRLIDRYSLPTLFVTLAALQPIGLGLAAVTSGIPMLLGLVLTIAALYGQVVINDAMVARYVPADHRAKAYSVRYFLGFTVSGFVVPMIALLHERGGFGLVLGTAAVFGLVIWLAALAFFGLARGDVRALAPAE
ncbi:MFS transporter, partial [Methylobacterium trifolii]